MPISYLSFHMQGQPDAGFNVVDWSKEKSKGDYFTVEGQIGCRASVMLYLSDLQLAELRDVCDAALRARYPQPPEDQPTFPIGVSPGYFKDADEKAMLEYVARRDGKDNQHHAHSYDEGHAVNVPHIGRVL